VPVAVDCASDHQQVEDEGDDHEHQQNAPCLLELLVAIESIPVNNKESQESSEHTVDASRGSNGDASRVAEATEEVTADT